MPPVAAPRTTDRHDNAADPSTPATYALPPLRRPTPRRLVAAARALASRPEVWQQHRSFDPRQRGAVRIASGTEQPEYEAWLLTWLPGQTTGLHDHGGSAGAFVVVEGRLEEATLAPPRRHQPAALVHRTLDAGRHRSFGPHHVHEVSCSDGPAVSVHVYAPTLAIMRRYELDGDGRAVIVARERAGVDW